MERIYTDHELIYAAHARCQCGAGLAHPQDCGIRGAWDCSAILTGRAIPKGQPGARTHDGLRPFVFWEVLSERQPSAMGRTTRPRPKPAPSDDLPILLRDA